MKALFIVCKVLFIICTVLFALLSFVDLKCVVFAVICLALSILISPTKMAQNYKDKQAKSGISPQRQHIASSSRTTTSAPAPSTKYGQAKQRIAENRAAGIACCPKCGSTSLSANKKGFSFGKAAAGAFAVGTVGLVGGTLGANKLEVTCLNCGHKFKPGKK